MKFDPLYWNEVANNGENQSPKGVLRVRCSQPSPLYVSSHGVEALAGHGTAFDLEVSEAVTWRLDGVEGTRVFAYAPPSTSMQASGEVFTNIDRMPDESGQLMEVRKALREFELQRRSALRQIREEAHALELARQQAQTPPPAATPPAATPAVEASAAPEDKGAAE